MTNLCSHCGIRPAVTLVLALEDDDLDGAEIGWCETQEIIDENTDEETETQRFVTGFCSKACIHLAGEYRHAMVESD
jgi:hypothetical protein